MAIGLWEASVVIFARQLGIPVQSVVMLGRQSMAVTPEILGRLRADYGVKLDSAMFDGNPWAEGFFQTQGASAIESLDYSDYEGATLIHDMNQPWPHGEPPRQFDIVFDGGSLEHVFNLPQALVNAMQLVKPGGAFIATTPADGWLGHGFYQLQPEVFFRLFRPERGFTLLGCWLGEFGVAPRRARLFRLKDPAVTGMRHLVPGKRPLAMMVCARKDAEVPLASLSWPAQSNYAAAWQQKAAPTVGSVGTTSLKRRLAGFLPASLRFWLQQRLAERRRFQEARAGWAEMPFLSVE